MGIVIDARQVFEDKRAFDADDNLEEMTKEDLIEIQLIIKDCDGYTQEHHEMIQNLIEAFEE